jgi:hypothetical protein
MLDVTMVTGSASVEVTMPITIKAYHLLPDVLDSLSVFIRDLYWLLKIDKITNLGRVKVALFLCVIRTKLNIGPVIPWTTLMVIWMTPVDVDCPSCVQ